MRHDAMIWIIVFSFGLIVGSFLNVCIHRLPLGASIMHPRSRCPNCETPIAPYDNIPVLSYLILRGRCRNCKTTISGRYPLVEFMTGLSAVAVYAHLGATPGALVTFVFVAALLTVSLIDLDHQIIPDVISLPGIVFGFVAAIVLGQPNWIDSLVGLLIGGGCLWLVAEAYYRLTGREGMGGGDIKLLAMIGAFLGWKAIPITVMFGSLVGSAVGIGLMMLRGRDSQSAIPFGPFLAAGGIVALFFGNDLIEWYLTLLRTDSY